MTEPPRHQSDSLIQREAEKLIRKSVARRLRIRLNPERITLPGGAVVDIDGVSHDPPVLVEIYARQGQLKGGQPHKLAKDALKLMTVRRLVLPDARLILALGSEDANRHFTGKGWMGEALRGWQVETMVIKIPDDLRQALVVAQARQRMVNPSEA